MADSNYEELRRLAAEATPGPWYVDQDKRPGMAWNRSIANSTGNEWVCVMTHDGGRDKPRFKASAEYIASANPATILSLLSELDALREDAERYRWLRRWKGQEHEPPFTVQHELDGTLWGGDLDHAIDAALHPSKDAGSGEVGNG